MAKTDTQEILVDRKQGSGRVIDWRGRKLANEYLAMAFDEIHPHTAQRLRACASHLVYGVDDKGRKRLRRANFCRVRLCPICQWRKSLKLYGQMMRVMRYLAPCKYNYIFLTLTVKNVKLDKLTDALRRITTAFNRLSKYDDFNHAAVGWYRGTEITHNLDIDSPDYDTFHPHIHVVIAVMPSYFTSRYYISQAKWGELWQMALGVDYVPRVDVRKVKGNTAKAVCEATKYSAKSRDYIILDDWDLTIETVKGLDAALKNRRLIGFGGVFMQARRQLEQEDVETGDLLHTDNADGDESKDQYYTSFGWHTGYCQYIREY